MKRTFEMPQTSSEAKKAKFNENREQNSPESTKAHREPVIYDIVNIKVEVPQSVDIETLLPTMEVNLEHFIKKEPEESDIITLTPEIVSTKVKTEPPSEPRRLSVFDRLRLNGKKIPKISLEPPKIHPNSNPSNESEKSDNPLILGHLKRPAANEDYALKRITLIPSKTKVKEVSIFPRVQSNFAHENVNRMSNDTIIKCIINGSGLIPCFKASASCPIFCPICPQILRNSDMFIHHAFKYHKWLQCFACNLQFTSVYDLNRHMRHGHSSDQCNSLLNCATCEFSAPNRLEWGLHLRLHMQNSLERIRRVSLPKDSRLQCPFCNVCFAMKRLLKRQESYYNHIGRMHRFYQCFACDYYAANYENLMKHFYGEHRKRETFDCVPCSYSAVDIKMWTKHFTSANHRRGPKKIGVFRCPKCLYNTNRPIQLYAHLHMAHSEFFCIFCDKFETNDERALMIHMDEEHKVPHFKARYKCSICPFAGQKSGISHVERYMDHHKEAKTTLLHSILAQGFALQGQPIKLENEEGEPNDVFIDADNIKVEIDESECLE